MQYERAVGVVVENAVEASASEREVVARWGGVVAGLFTLLALLALFSEIGMAIGFSVFEAGDRAAAYAIGAGIWGTVAAVLSFMAGGYVASRISRHVRSRAGATQGLLVWAVAVPVIGFLAAVLAIGTVGAAGVATVAAVQADPVAAAEARDAARSAAPRTDARLVLPEHVTKGVANRAAATGWAAVAAMLLSLAAAVLGGSLGTRWTTRVVTRTTSAPIRTLPVEAQHVAERASRLP